MTEGGLERRFLLSRQRSNNRQHAKETGLGRKALYRNPKAGHPGF